MFQDGWMSSGKFSNAINCLQR